MAKISKPILYLGLAAIGVVGYFMTEPETAKQTSVPKPKAKTSKKQEAGKFLEVDYKITRADLPKLASLDKNTFSPIIARQDGLGDLTQEGGIPADFAGGDGNWVCTGTAEVDGVRMALIENKSTGEGEFLRAGQSWKSAVVSQILDDGVVMAGPGGNVVSIMVLEEQWNPEPEAAPEVAPVAPTNIPGMNGPIGGNAPMNLNENGRGRRGGRGDRGGSEVQLAPPPATMEIIDEG
jgi:hypothetical protein